MLKVSVEQDAHGSKPVRLRLEGQVNGAWVDELHDSCRRFLAAGLRLTLDLEGVSFIDRNGVGLLRTLGQRGVVVIGPSRFVAEQLRGWAHAGTEDSHGPE